MTVKYVRNLALVVVMLATVAACGRNSDAKAIGGSQGPKEVPTTVRKSTGDPIKDAELIVADGYTGNITQPPATGPKAVKGKRLFIISCYQLLDSCKIPSESAQAAAKEIGWETTVVDGGLDAGKESEGIKQAINLQADAIILVAIDCAPVQASLQQAKQAGIILVGLFAFDCDDESIANPGAPLFDYILRVGDLGPADSAITLGEVKAAYAIAKLDGKVVAINTTSPNHAVLQYVAKGFTQQMAKCKTCRIASTVSFSDEDVLSGKLRDTLVTTLQSYPTTNVIQVAVDAVFQIAVLPALADMPEIMTLGGEGMPANMDLIRSGKETMAMAVPNEWAGWLGVDVVNRLLAGEKPSQIPNEGFGYQIIDKDHNIPPSGPYVPLHMETKKPVDFKAAYRTVWGIE